MSPLLLHLAPGLRCLTATHLWNLIVPPSYLQGTDCPPQRNFLRLLHRSSQMRRACITVCYTLHLRVLNSSVLLQDPLSQSQQEDPTVLEALTHEELHLHIIRAASWWVDVPSAIAWKVFMVQGRPLSLETWTPSDEYQPNENLSAFALDDIPQRVTPPWVYMYFGNFARRTAWINLSNPLSPL